jgi:predicted nucleic acid-binding protein
MTVLDASVVIGFLDARDLHHARAVAAIRAIAGGDVILPATAYAELMVAPLRRKVGAAVERFLADFPMRVQPLTVDIARRAARLRARHRTLGLPAAVVLATGDAVRADAILTADRAWSRFGRRVKVI